MPKIEKSAARARGYDGRNNRRKLNETSSIRELKRWVFPDGVRMTNDQINFRKFMTRLK
jgi:hypothetical protein